MRKSIETKPIRELMPRGFTATIAKATGAQRSYISVVVADERTSAEIWPAVEQLARETNPAEAEARIAYLTYRKLAA